MNICRQIFRPPRRKAGEYGAEAAFLVYCATLRKAPDRIGVLSGACLQAYAQKPNLSFSDTMFGFVLPNIKL